MPPYAFAQPWFGAVTGSSVQISAVVSNRFDAPQSQTPGVDFASWVRQESQGWMRVQVCYQ